MTSPTSTIGRYRLVRRLGSGGMGVVYEAVDTRDESRVAIKVLLPHAAEEQEGLLRFKREFRALARLRHPNIVRVYDAGIENDIPFIVMEFLEGRDIRKHLRAIPEGPPRDREMRRCLRQILGALAHIHARRIVHRDLKPENILVSNDGRVKLMDFGVALLLRAPVADSGLLGTFAYMAPEQVTTGEIDGRSDLYAIGVLMYEVLAGQYPFPVEPPAAALHHHVHTPPDPIFDKNPRADPALVALAHRLLEKDPLNRPQSAEEVFRHLSDQGGEAPIENIQPGQLFTPRVVCRDRELITLDQMMAATSEGRGGLMIIEGPTGIGKSRLIREFAKSVRQKTHVLIGHCAAEKGLAYGAIQPVLDEIATIASRSPADVVRRIVGEDVAVVSAVSPRLASLGGSATADKLDPSDRKLRLHKAIVGIIGRLALAKSVLWVVEDVQWADSASLELLWDAIRTLLAARPHGVPGETVCPLFIILTRRSLAEGSDESESLVRRLEATRKVEHLQLGPLDAAGVAEMLRTMTGVNHPREDAVTELVNGARGRPLLVQEIAQAWLSEGQLVRKGGDWYFRGELLLSTEAVGPRTGELSTIRPAMSDGVPEAQMAPLRKRTGLGEDVMAAKISRLDVSPRIVLQRVSLLGRLVPADLVFAVSGLTEESFLDAVDDLVRGGYLVEDVARDGVRYRFYHEDFREAVVRSIKPEEKIAMHRFIATQIERKFRARRHELAPVLARHFRSGMLAARAVRYFRYMAQASAARGDLEAALRRLSDALQILDELPRTTAVAQRRLVVLLQQIDLLLDFGRAREALDRADPQAGDSARSPKMMEAELLLRRAASLFHLGRFDTTIETLAKLDGRAPSCAIGARSLALEGQAYAAKGDYDKARAVFEAGRDIAASGGFSDLAQDLDAKVGMVLLHGDEHEAALDKLEKGLELARKRKDMRAVVELVGHIGLFRAAEGHHTEALACFQEALELSEARGVRAEIERWSGELGLLMRQEQPESAQIKLERALELARDAGNKQGEATWRTELGILLLALGSSEKASSELFRALATAKEIGFPLYEGWASVYLGAAAIDHDLGGLARARDHIERAHEISLVIGHSELRLVSLLQLARLSRAEGDIQAARAWKEESEMLLERVPALRNRGRVAPLLAAAEL